MSILRIIFYPVLILLFLLAYPIILLVGWALRLDACPREIRGYQCQGDGCDHSREQVDEALRDMERV